MERWWNRHWALVYVFLALMQVPFLVMNLASGGASIAFLSLLAIAATGVAFEFVAGLQRKRRSRANEVRAFLHQARLHNDEDAEKLALQLLAIWEPERPVVPTPPDDQTDGGLSA